VLRLTAHKSSADVATLTENAFVKTAERRYVYRHQELTRDNLRRGTVVVCPKCLAEDLDAAPRSRQPTSAPAGRSRPCGPARSTSRLVVVDKDMTPKTMRDWSHHVGKILPNLTRLAAETGTRPLTGFETYVLHRVNGGCARGGLIDTLPLHVAIAACELFGAVASFGRIPNLKMLTDEG
jgi:hypothetical protein